MNNGQTYGYNALVEYYAEKDIWIEEKRLPMSVHGFVCRKNGQTFMVINSDLSDEAKQEAFNHELDHIEHDDLYSEEDAVSIESRREKENAYHRDSCDHSVNRVHPFNEETEKEKS